MRVRAANDSFGGVGAVLHVVGRGPAKQGQASRSHTRVGMQGTGRDKESKRKGPAKRLALQLKGEKPRVQFLSAKE